MLTWGITEEANCWVRADEQGTFQVETGTVFAGDGRGSPIRAPSQMTARRGSRRRGARRRPMSFP